MKILNSEAVLDVRKYGLKIMGYVKNYRDFFIIIILFI